MIVKRRTQASKQVSFFAYLWKIEVCVMKKLDKVDKKIIQILQKKIIIKTWKL